MGAPDGGPGTGEDGGAAWWHRRFSRIPTAPYASVRIPRHGGQRSCCALLPPFSCRFHCPAKIKARGRHRNTLLSRRTHQVWAEPPGALKRIHGHMCGGGVVGACTPVRGIWWAVVQCMCWLYANSFAGWVRLELGCVRFELSRSSSWWVGRAYMWRDCDEPYAWCSGRDLAAVVALHR